MSRLREKTTATLLIAIFMISAIAIVVPTFAKNKGFSTFILGDCEVIVPEGFVAEVFASGFNAEDMAFDDLGDLYVATFNFGQVLKIDVLPDGTAGDITVLVEDLDYAAGLTYSSSEEFGKYLYVSETDRGTPDVGKISKVDVNTGLIMTFASDLHGYVEGLAFGPGGAWGKDLYACYNGYIAKFDSNGNPTTLSELWAEELVFDTTGLFGYNMYVASYDGLFQVDQEGFVLPFGGIEISEKNIEGIAFGPGGAWGNDLYAVQFMESEHIYKIAPDGKVSVFATFSQPKEHFFEELLFDSSGNLFVSTQLEGLEGDISCIVKISRAGKIAFVSDRDGDYEIFVMNSDGSDQIQLTENSNIHDAHPVWSPNWDKIAFMSYVDDDWEIFVMNSDGSDQTQLTDNDEYDRCPEWSPDGSKILFTRIDHDVGEETWVMNSDGSGETRLTYNTLGEWNPVWSPDGSKIAFARETEHGDDIYVMNSDGSEQTLLHKSIGVCDYLPDWSPDGSKIAFTRSPGQFNREIWVMNSDGTGVTRLTIEEEMNSFHPSWTYDGSKIVFASDRDGDREIFVMNSDGSNQVQLTDNEYGDWCPDYYPPKLTRRDILHDKGIPGKGIDEAPGLDKPIPNENFAKGRNK